MASIKDSVEEAFQDNNSLLKFILFAIPLFIIVNYSQENIPGYNLWVILTSLLLFGFMLYCTYNVRAGESQVLPSFNIFSILLTGLKGIIALAPMAIVSIFLSKFIVNILTTYIPDESVVKVFSYIVYGICGSFVYTSYLLYATKFKIMDAYNIKSIFAYCVDVLVAILFMVIQVILVDAIMIAPVTYIIWLFFGIPHPVAIFFWSIIFIYTLAIVGHYLAQISYEIIEVKETKKND